MLDRTKQYKTVASSVIGVLLVAALVFLVLTIMGSSQANTTGYEMVAIGPIELIELGKVPVAEGYQVSIALRTGIAFYLTFALMVGVTVGFIRIKLAKTPSQHH